MSNRRLLVFLGCGLGAGCAVATGCSSSSGASGGTGGAGGSAGQPALTSAAGAAGMPPAPTSTTPVGTGGVGAAGASTTTPAAGGIPSIMPPIGKGGAAGAAVMPPASGGAPPAMPTGTVAPPPVGSCAAPPADAPSNAVQAIDAVNKIRLATGSGCMNLVSALTKSATAHCGYLAMNTSNSMCTADPHGEVTSCAGFTGANVQAREIAAGYPATLAYTEVLTFYGNNPVAAVPGWINTVWHRIPLLDPWTMDMGYGGGTMCDIIDIGRGMSTTPSNVIAVYPYDGQTNVPPSFSGQEGPAPPAPPGGWPSSFPINIYAQRLSVTEHTLTKDGDATPIEHLWLDAQSSLVSAGLKGYFLDTAFLYGAPFAANTKYHVKIAGTYAGGALQKEWSFTTGAKNPFGP